MPNFYIIPAATYSMYTYYNIVLCMHQIVDTYIKLLILFYLIKANGNYEK